MNTNGQHIDAELIARYLSGEASPPEKQKLDTWLESSEENRRLFEQYRSVWEKMDRVSSVAGLDLDAEWDHLESLIEKAAFETKPEKQRKHQEIIIGKERTIGAERVSGRETIDSPVKRYRRNVFVLTRLAAAAVVVVMLAIGGLYTWRNVGYLTLVTAGQSEAITLPDGSTVTLNSHSSLRYPKKFRTDRRGVSLEGEGFFEVNANPDWPFVITTSEVNIKVLGTSFNVSAYEKDAEIEVVVETGQVAVTRPGEIPKTVILKPGNKAVYNKKKEDLSLSTEIDRNYLAWKTRNFVFEDESLVNVAEALNHVYGSQISIPSDSLKTARITTTFNEQSLDAILNVLAATLDLEIVEYDGRILLKESN
jgi:ferric-dicitrate binding protein FerR (iron transport regulator)